MGVRGYGEGVMVILRVYRYNERVYWEIEGCIGVPRRCNVEGIQ